VRWGEGVWKYEIIVGEWFGVGIVLDVYSVVCCGSGGERGERGEGGLDFNFRR